MIDSRDIKDLHPTLQRGANEFIRRCKMIGIDVLITSTYRCHEYQNKLYAQGRTAPGNIVTNCKGGESMHNWRTAYDFAPYTPGSKVINWNTANPLWKQCGDIWLKMGGEWGGAWKNFIDMPHCEFTNGLTLRCFQGGKCIPSNARMPWEKDVDEIDHIMKIKFENQPVKEIPSVLKNDLNHPQLRALMDIMGYSVSYDDISKVISLTKK